MSKGPETRDFLNLARQTAEHEALRERPLFALLTGSAAWGTTSSRSDIDIIFIVADSDAVSYRYYLPELAGVAVRTEVGRIPLAYLEKVLGSGYADEITTGIREQIRNAKVLFGDRDLAEKTIARFSDLKPRKKLLGEYLFEAKQALAKARGALAAGDLTEAVVSMDAMAKNAWRLALVAKHQVGVQKDKHELRAARTQLGCEDLARYEVSRRIPGIAKAQAHAALAASQQVISRVFELSGIDDRIIGDLDQ
ncbi:MAG TPA: hypothetical protein VMU02_00560 [bacterium]|nr:hypothetical protein [bacterium]